MSMKNKFTGWLMAAALLGTASCTKILDQQPGSALDATTAFTTPTAVAAGVSGIYNGLQSGNYYGLRYWALTDLYADVLRHTGTFPSFAEVANRNILSNNVEVTNMWNTIYATVNRTNNIIAAIPKVTDPAFTNKAVLEGEARFARALCYFDLVRLWGGSTTGYNKAGGLGVPLFLDPTLTPENAVPKPRATEQDVYAQIAADLDFAIANLPTTQRTGRPNVDAATALKARLELYRGNNAAAETLATQVIDKYTTATAFGGLAPVYSDLWLTQNVKPESIFELQYDATNVNAIAFFYFTGAYGGRNEITAATTLAGMHEAGDKRLPVNVTTASTQAPANKTLKYTRVAGTDNVIIIRLAELYLIRAEARAKLGADLAGAKADVDVIRARAGLAPTAAATQAELLAAIEKENLLEFAHEGHRFFDLRRNNREDDVLGFTGQNEFKARWPIPQREQQTSGNVVEQNPGY
jgi:starch-binding outer membrane protein, SusD/RagB family